jgi:hypothetical protein
VDNEYLKAAARTTVGAHIGRVVGRVRTGGSAKPQELGAAANDKESCKRTKINGALSASLLGFPVGRIVQTDSATEHQRPWSDRQKFSNGYSEPWCDRESDHAGKKLQAACTEIKSR